MHKNPTINIVKIKKNLKCLESHVKDIEEWDEDAPYLEDIFDDIEFIYGYLDDAEVS